MTCATSSRVDIVKLANTIMDNLSAIQLEPRPHFRVLPPPKQQDEPRLWDVGGRNEVGYILEDRNGKNQTYTTSLSFKARSASTNFIDIEVSAKSRIGSAGIMLDVKTDGESTQQTSLGREATLEILLIGGSHPKSIRLRIVKSIKHDDGVNRLLFKVSNETEPDWIKEGDRKFEFGCLLDLTIRESTDGPLQCDLAEVKGYGLLPLKQSDTRSIVFQDYYVAQTNLPRPKGGKTTIKELSGQIQSRVAKQICPSIQKFVECKVEVDGGRLYDFQNRAILEIFSQMHGDRKPCVVIARTAAGKTEAFAIPILTRVLDMKMAGLVGVKAILFYPTKALATDQLQRLFEFAAWINEDTNDKLTLGVYHGDIEERSSLKIPLPLRCVKHEKELEIGDVTPAEIRLVSDEKGVLSCSKCGTEYPYILADRYNTTLCPPDILVCTPDILNRILMLDRQRHVFIGAETEVTHCPNCRLILKKGSSNCFKCGSKSSKAVIRSNTPPDIILLDELHLFSSLFGGNVSHLLRRLEHVIAHYHKNKEKKVQFIATSATVRNPAEFGKNFFGVDVSLIQTTDADYDFDKSYSKVVVFASPRAYRMIDSVSYALYRTIAMSDLRILTFVNSLTLSSMLLNLTKQRLSADVGTSSLVDSIDGHSSNYTRQERAETEERFNAGKIRILVATSTLEVGVDFKGLDGLALYGAPYTFNNYLQRIGRAGRNNDAVVFVFLNPDDPIDLSYFRNAIKLAADPTAFIEYPPFPVGNKVLRRKHVMCTILDISSIFGEDAVALFKALASNKKFSNPQPQEYLEEIWDKEAVEETADVLREVQGIEDDKLVEYIEKKFNLFDMRKVDDTVRVEFEEPHGYGSRSTHSSWGHGGGPFVISKYHYRALRSAGLTNSDIDTLKKLKGG